MLDPNSDESEEKPLDPAVVRVQVKLQRLMLIAGLTLGFGMLAVFGAIIYRINAADNTPSAPAVVEVVAPSAPTSISAPTEAPQAPAIPAPDAAPAAPLQSMINAEAQVPADARLIASTVAADRIVLTFDHLGGTILLLVDPASLAVVGRLDVRPE